jgi:hypothetical protein
VSSKQRLSPHPGFAQHQHSRKFNDVTIHKIDLKGRQENLDTPSSMIRPYIVKTWSITRLRAETAFYYMQIFRNLVVIACEGGSESDVTDGSNKHLIVFNTDTEATYIIRSPAFSVSKLGAAFDYYIIIKTLTCNN